MEFIYIKLPNNTRDLIKKNPKPNFKSYNDGLDGTKMYSTHQCRHIVYIRLT